MDQVIDIWLVGNTGLRNPNRIQEGFAVYANSPYVGNLRGKDNEIGFMNLLNQKGIIQNETGKDMSGSHARKWRLMFAKNGFIYPKTKFQKELGELDTITPFGRSFLQADTYQAVQESYLRALSVEQHPVSNGEYTFYFSPLRWLLSIMIELERQTGSSEISRIEFALWVQTSNPNYKLEDIVSNILDLRNRRSKAQRKKIFDRKEIKSRSIHYNKKESNFRDYCDMNMRYLRISGLFQRKGRGLIISPTKYLIASKLAKSTFSESSLLDQLRSLCLGAPLPIDDKIVAKNVLNNIINELNAKHIIYDISDLNLANIQEINIARQRLEKILSQIDEINYASQQLHQWNEIADYMTLLINGGGKIEYDEDYAIEIPKDETPVYFEWIIWRAFLAINSLKNKPYEIRGFSLDSDYLPVSTAGGGRGDLYCIYEDYVILIEVTMSTSSRQESMEGEPVRRHVANAIEKYKKPVYCLFIAIKVDTNTIETFRHGIWYTKDDEVYQLDILPLNLAQFKFFFESIFKSKTASPDRLMELINRCKLVKNNVDAPGWRSHIHSMIHA